MKINQYEFDHMTNMAVMHVYGKNILKSFFSGTNGPNALNLVCSIMVLRPIIVYSNDVWLDLDPIYRKVKFGCICFCMGKSGNCKSFQQMQDSCQTD